MGKVCKAANAEEGGKGKVSPLQVALIVDRYLSDNNYSKTLSLFRSEASIIISQAKGREVPKSLLSLGAMLDEYICLKEQKFILDQEKSRVEVLLKGMQDVMQAYNSAGSTCPSMEVATTPVPQTGPRYGLPAAGYPSCGNITANSTPMLPSTVLESTNYSTPIANLPVMNKRKGSKLVSDASPAVKKSCAQLSTNLSSTIGGTKIPSKAENISTTCENVRQFSTVQSTSHNRTQNGPSLQGSCVAKSLFKQHNQSQTPCPKTPPQAFPSQTDQSISPIESSSLVNSANSNTSQEISSTNSHVISFETVVRSPFKHTSCYSMDWSHHVPSSPLKSNQKRLNKRDHIKGRLDFDGSNVPLCSEKPVSEEISTLEDVDEMAKIFDFDISTFHAFGTDFSLSELLVDIDLENEEMTPPLQHAVDPLIDFITGPKHESGNRGSETNQASSHPLSSVKAVLSERDTNIQGPESVISVKSIRKCTKSVSPVKSRSSSSSEQEN